jgi:sulfur-carrier protein
MSVIIRIPTPLRKFTAGQETVEVEGTTVGQALENLAESHPELRAKIFGDDGQVRRFVNVFANDEDIRFQDKLETALKDGDQVSIIPAIAGGRK